MSSLDPATTEKIDFRFWFYIVSLVVVELMINKLVGVMLNMIDVKTWPGLVTGR